MSSAPDDGSYAYGAYGTVPYGGGTGAAAAASPTPAHAVGLGAPSATGAADRQGAAEASGVAAAVASGKASEAPQVVGLGQPSASGMRRAAILEALGVGAVAGTGRRTDFSVVGLGAGVAAGRRSDVECVGLVDALVSGQRSTAPAMMGVGGTEAFGQRPVAGAMEGLATSEALGSRQSTSAAVLVGLGAVEVPALAHPEMFGTATADVVGQRLFPRRRLAPGWLKIRRSQVEEWTTEPPPVQAELELKLLADSAWYGPFEEATYTDNFYPGDGFGKQLIELTPTTAVFVYRYFPAPWYPPVDGPYYNGGAARDEAPIAARLLTLDPATGEVTAGPEVLVASHPLVEGAGENVSEGDAWASYPEFWSFDLVATSSTETTLLMRFYDGEGFYDPYPGRPYLYSGVEYSDSSYSSTGLLQVVIDWEAGTASHGPFHRMGGPVGLKEAYWGQDLAVVTDEEYYENPGEFDYWSWDVDEGEELVLTRMLTATRGVALFTNGWEDYQLIVTTFDLDAGGVVTELDTYAFPRRSVSTEGMIYYYGGARVLRLSPTRFAVLATSDDPVQYQNMPACWSFSIDGAGLITFQGKALGASTKLYPEFMGGEVATPNDVVFREANQDTDWATALSKAHVPDTGPPTFSTVLTSTQLAHPDQDPGYFYKFGLGSDGDGHWVAVWGSYQSASPFEDHLYARGGRIIGEALESAEPVQVSADGTDFYYSWESWGSWLGANRFLYGRLASQAGEYSVRTAVLELTGGTGGL